MESVPPEIIEAILAHASEYSPALRRVCTSWSWVVSRLSGPSKVLSLSSLAARGETALIVWARECRGAPFPQKCADSILLSAAEHGHSSLVSLALTWGGSCVVAAASRAARGGHVPTLLALAEPRGWEPATMMSLATEAMAGDHEGVVLALVELGLPYYMVLPLAAARGREALAKLALDKMRDSRGKVWIKSGTIAILAESAGWGGNENTARALCEACREQGPEMLKKFSAGLLYGAARRGHNALVALAIELGGDELERSLMTALSYGHLQAALLIKEAYVMRGGQLAPERLDRVLDQAAMGGHAHLVDLLLDWGASGHRADKLLVSAADLGHEPVVRALLRRGFTARAMEAAEAAIAANHENIVQALVGFVDPDRALIAAAAFGSERIVRLVVGAGAANFSDALIMAETFGHANVASMLRLWMNEDAADGRHAADG